MESLRTAHKVRKTGGKVKKKKQGDGKERHNPKAFTFSGGINSVRRRVQRSLDTQTKRERAELIVDQTPVGNAPPFIIVIQGPGNVGKTTLIRSLVKHYTRQNVSSVKGPITLVSGKSRRVTFVECPNDIPSMIDLAKIADLAVLMIDASFGFEMETFEFLNILQTHGFPRVLGILTHLDKFIDNKSLKKRKKTLKNRFWAEIYDGAKLFYLSGLQYGRYNKTEILNLTRFLSIQKCVPLLYRSERPYLLALKYEEQISTDHSSEVKNINVYGYVKGSTLRSGISVHIPGCGDLIVKSVDQYLDPCPLPSNGVENSNDGGRLLRTLKVEHRRIYAPDCNIGNVRYEENGMYINVPDHKTGFTKDEDLKTDSENETICNDESTIDDTDDDDEIEIPEAVSLVRSLQNADEQLDKTLDQQTLKLLPTSKVIASHSEVAIGRNRRKVSQKFVDTIENERIVLSGNRQVESDEEIKSGSDDDGYDENEIDFNERIKATDRINAVHTEVNKKFKKEISLNDLIYGIRNLRINESVDESQWFNRFDRNDEGMKSKMLFEEDDDETNEFRKNDSKIELMGDLDSNIDKNLVNAEEGNLLSDMFLYRGLGISPNSINEIEQFWIPSTKKLIRAQHFITGGWDGEDRRDTLEKEKEAKNFESKDKEPNKRKGPRRDERTVDEIAAELLAEKQMKKEELEKRKKLLSEAQSLVTDGAIIGTYVRIVIEGIPIKWFEYMKEEGRPIIVGGLLSGETQLGMIQARVKRHRWSPKILKSNDPILISCGWRRFQSIPLYCLEDRGNVRIRMLKYTPEHLHCLTTFYGPISAPSTGIVLIRNWANNVKNFRISATGLVLDTSPDFKIVKKLKLIGEPTKIMKNTAFIKRMFTSDLEVSKCISAKIQTVSGIRGQIKKAVGKDGTFRGTFEDRILMSDIVICKAWIKIEPKMFWNPLLDIPGWRRIRTQAEIRNDYQFPAPDSNKYDYGLKQERQTRRFNPLKIPISIERELPFKSRPKNDKPQKKKNTLISECTTVRLDDYEKTVATMFNRLHLLAKEKKRDRSEALMRKLAVKQKEESRVNEIRQENQKEGRKRRAAMKGVQQARERKRLRIDG